MTHFMVGGELADGDEDIFTRENRSIAVTLGAWLSKYHTVAGQPS